MDLSAAQQAAVTRSGQDACCVAGPGSGKTRVLVERYAWLIEQGLEPHRILAITFTEKAAVQIRQRLARRFTGREDLRRKVERAPVSTIHGLCSLILRESALEANLDPGFSVLDERQARTELYAALQATLDAFTGERHAAMEQLIEHWRYGASFEDPLLRVYGNIRSRGPVSAGLAVEHHFDVDAALNEVAADVEAMLAECPPAVTKSQASRVESLRAWLASRQDMDALLWLNSFRCDRRGLREGHPIHATLPAIRLRIAQASATVLGYLRRNELTLLRDILREMDDRYRARKRALASVDFGDLEEFALDLLKKRTDVRRHWAERFDAILMDELQDTNPVQWSIVDLLRRESRFFAVGDVNQSIYRFRHANPRQFEDYENQVSGRGGVIDRLETNYRSHAEILNAVSATVPYSPGLRPHQLQPRPGDHDASVPRVEVQINDVTPNGDCWEEDWIARRILQWRSDLPAGDPPRRLRFSDIAVLVRTAAQFTELEAAFDRAGIPCVVSRGRDFFERQEIVDLINFLRVIDNPKHDLALAGLLRSPFFALPEAETFRAKFRGEWPPRWCAERIESWRRYRVDQPLDRILAQELDTCGYWDGLEQRARANVEKFLSLLQTLQTQKGSDPSAVLNELEALRASGDEPNAPVVEAGDAVQLMTIHSAKGLEFPAVILAGLHKGTNTKADPLLWSPRLGLGANWVLPGTDGGQGDRIHKTITTEESEADALEADRLLYVALTRAEQHVLVSWTRSERPASKWPMKLERAWNLTPPAQPNQPEIQGSMRVTFQAGPPPGMPREEMPVAAMAAVENLAPLAAASIALPVLSATALSRFPDCPRRFYYSQVLGWSPLRGGTGGQAEFGSEVHALLAGSDEEPPSPRAEEILLAFQESELARQLREAQRVEREFAFLVQMGDRLIRGQIDLWFQSSGQVVLVDYKTGEASEERLNAYRLQIQIYALALQQMLGRLPDRAELVFVEAGETIAVNLSSATQQVREVLAEEQEAEREGRFELRPGDRCFTCPYRHAPCPARDASRAPAVAQLDLGLEPVAPSSGA